MAGKTSLPVRDEGVQFLRREGMAPETGDFLHSHAVYFPILVTAEASILLRSEGMHLPAVTILTGQLFHEHMTGMTCRLVNRQGPLRSVVPMTFCTCFPGGFVAVRLRSLAVRGEYEFDQEPVLLDQAELMTILADHVPVAAQFPRPVGLFHEMAAVAELGVLLDVIVVPDGKNDPQDRDDEHQRNNDDFVPRA